MTTKTPLELKIESFFNSLTMEKDNFSLPLTSLLQYRLLARKEENNEIVGIAEIIDGDEFFVVVKKSHQNFGIGQSLAKSVIYEASRKGYDDLVLSVFKSNVSAFHLYQKLGFKIVFSSLAERAHTNNAKEAYFMVLPLNWRGTIFIDICKICAFVSRIIEQRVRTALRHRLMYIWKNVFDHWAHSRIYNSIGRIVKDRND